MTYTDFINIVIAEIGRDNTAIRNRIDEWTNTAIHSIYTDLKLWLARKKYERTITQGVRSYSMPPLIDDSILVYYLTTDGTTWNPIDVKSDRNAIIKYGPNDTGFPEMVVITKIGLDVYPLPDISYTLRILGHFYEEPLTTTSSDNQQSLLLNEDPDVVRFRVIQRAFQFLEEYSKAEYNRVMYEGQDGQGGELKKLRRKNVRRVLSGDFNLWPSSDVKGLENR